MSHISILAVLISTIAYVFVYYLFFSPSFFGKKLTNDSVVASDNFSPVTADKLLLVLICGFIFSYFLALFMLMAERSGMADGIKSAFMLTLINFCIPALIYFKLNNLNWNKYFKTCLYVLTSHIIAGALIGYWS
ncbi:MAG: hypothetical protein ABIO44_05465 [Saprospiraceae bacterium]